MADKLKSPYRYVYTEGVNYDTPGRTYTIEYDAMMCGWLKSTSGNAAYIRLDGVQIIGVANQQMYLAVPVKKGQVLTTRGESYCSYDLRFFPYSGGGVNLQIIPRVYWRGCAA